MVERNWRAVDNYLVTVQAETGKPVASLRKEFMSNVYSAGDPVLVIDQPSQAEGEFATTTFFMFQRLPVRLNGIVIDQNKFGVSSEGLHIPYSFGVQINYRAPREAWHNLSESSDLILSHDFLGSYYGFFGDGQASIVPDTYLFHPHSSVEREGISAIYIGNGAVQAAKVGGLAEIVGVMKRSNPKLTGLAKAFSSN